MTRILALHLPDLLIELSLQRKLADAGTPHDSSQRPERRLPGAVILSSPSDPPWEPSQPLDAVNVAARRLGIAAQQTIAQARALAGALSLQALPRTDVESALQRVADVALAYGTPVAIRSPDGVWVDVTGTAHLFSGEHALALELLEQVRSLGYSARAAIADGPWLSRALARHAASDASGVLSVDDVQKDGWLRQLPVSALPLRPEAAVFFARLGLLSIGQLQALPQSALASRLQEQLLTAREGGQAGGAFGSGSHVRRLAVVLDLISGCDPAVLIPYQPEPLPEETWLWDDPTESLEPLLFVLKGLSARIGARLEGRGQAAQSLSLTVHHDPSIFELRRRDADSEKPESRLELSLASPLEHARDIERVLRTRLSSAVERGSSRAPTVGLSLRVTSITDARRAQLELGASSLLSTDPRVLTVVASELSVDVGDDAVGLLVEVESLLPEKRSQLSPLRDRPPPASRAQPPSEHRLPTRLLARPLDVGPRLGRGEILWLGQQAFVIESLRLEQRLEDVEWWTPDRIFRDYFRAWLYCLSPQDRLSPQGQVSASRPAGGLEALLYWDRLRTRGYLHALYD